MKKMSRFWIVFFLITTLLGLDLQAQTGQQAAPKLRENFKKEELKQFVEVSKKVNAVQMKAQKAMVKAIQEEGLSVEQFNEMAKKQQLKEKSNASAQEASSFNKAAQKIMSMQDAVNGQIKNTIREDGFDVHTYQEILYAYQKSPKVKDEVNTLLKEE